MHDHADIVEMLIDDYGVDVKEKKLELGLMAQLSKKNQVLNLLIEKYGCKIQFSQLTMEVRIRMYVCVYNMCISSCQVFY